MNNLQNQTLHCFVISVCKNSNISFLLPVSNASLNIRLYLYVVCNVSGIVIYLPYCIIVY